MIRCKKKGGKFVYIISVYITCVCRQTDRSAPVFSHTQFILTHIHTHTHTHWSYSYTILSLYNCISLPPPVSLSLSLSLSLSVRRCLSPFRFTLRCGSVIYVRLVIGRVKVMNARLEGQIGRAYSRRQGQGQGLTRWDFLLMNSTSYYLIFMCMLTRDDRYLLQYRHQYCISDCMY